MNKKILLRIAAGLVLFTCVGHTIGTFMPPVGKSQSFFDILFGANIGLSVYLFVSGISLILISSEEKFHSTSKRLLFLESLGLLALAVISVLYFFPVPAICTGIAGVLGLFISIRQDT